MGQPVAIEVSGVGSVGGWLASPERAPRGALVVVQEIFGVNAHIRAVVDGFAREGYVALAPALLDPVERDVELGYDDDGFKRGRALVGALGVERAVAIVDAAAQQLRSAAGAAGGVAVSGLAVGVVGFCWGGTIAYLANTRLGLPAVSYYGARTIPFLGEALRAPMMFHFGERDESIPATDIAAHAAAHPEAIVHVYPGAGHAFNRDVDPRHYVAESARLAHQRTLDFFTKSLAQAAPG